MRGSPLRRGGRPRRAWPALLPGSTPPVRLLGLLLALLVAVPATAQPGEIMDLSTASSDWAGSCDNQGRCTMIGWARLREPEPDQPMLLRVEFLHEAVRPTRISVRPQPGADRVLTSRLELPGPYVFNFPGEDGQPVPIEARDYQLPEATALALYRHLLVGHRIAATHPRAASQRMRFAEQGFSEVWASLRGIGQAQLRRHRLHRREQRRHVLQIYSGFEMDQEQYTGVQRLPPVPLNSFCSLLTGVPYQLHRFGLNNGAGRELWQLSCRQRSHNRITQFFLREQGAEQGAPLLLETADRSVLRAGEQGIPGAQFDFDFGVIRAVRYDGEGEDCGTSWVWGWTGRAFVLLEQREMPRCGGITEPDWIPVYRRAAAGPDT
jgi:hypothetical protein